jgi:prepilin-type N-terminal cleavage/methylation domain-containing protein
MITTSRVRHRGFTLVELLVAMALIVFIMVILTEAFTAGTGVFRTLKSQGDMQERLRVAGVLLRDDLYQRAGQRTHFADTDPLLSGMGMPGQLAQPTQGYFYIQQPLATVPPGTQGYPNGAQVPSFQEGLDGFGNPSIRMGSPFNTQTGALPALAFTLHRKGNRPEDYFAARIPGAVEYPTLPAFTASELLLFGPPATGTPSPTTPADYQSPPRTATNPNATGLFMSQWAEVGYFLVPTGRTAGTTNPQMPLYSLRRRLRVVLNDAPTQATLNGSVPTVLPNGQNLLASRYAEVSCYDNGGSIYFNTPRDLVSPAKQTMPSATSFSFTPLGASPGPGLPVQGQPTWAGDDLVLTDVISFNVRALAGDTTGTYVSNFPGSGGFLPSNQGQPTWLATNPGDFLDIAAANATPFPAPPPPGGNPPPQFNMPAAPNPVYNTGTPPQYAIRALEITIRVWDVKTSLARQVTIIQDM